MFIIDFFSKFFLYPSDKVRGDYIVSDVSGRISSITGSAPGGREDVQGCFGNRPRSGSRLLQSSFPGGRGDGGAGVP